ncbi:MAG: YraN family protein [Lachnospiraceae bacterium]|nr:YraN family protein [Lachnospiraceae bacterium]
MENTRQTGTFFELKAEECLKEAGCAVVGRNFRVRSGEIDLIFMDGSTLCFGEVKARRSSLLGTGASAVGRNKQYRLSRTADYYMAREGLDEALSYRFDVMDFTDGSFRWIKNAFDYIPKR